MFTWQNLVGHWAGQDRAGGLHNRAFREDALTGVVLAGPAGATDEPWSGTFAIAAEAAPGLRLSTRNRFDADDGADVWADFSADGSLDDVDDPTPSRPGEAIGAALAATFELAPGEARTVAFSLAWDFPSSSSAPGGAGIAGTRGSSARPARQRPAIAAEALANRAGVAGGDRRLAGGGARRARPSGLVSGCPVQRALLPRGRGLVLGGPRGGRGASPGARPVRVCSSASTIPSTTRSTSTSTRRSRWCTCGPTSRGG